MSTLDRTDLFMMGFVALMAVAGTAFIFLYPSTANFVTWAGMLTGSGGLFHGLRVYDQKRPDSQDH